MNNATFKIQLTEDGFEKIEERIQKIENLANNGIFAKENGIASLYQIASEAKNLRQLMRNVLVIVPAVSNGEAGAA